MVYAQDLLGADKKARNVSVPAKNEMLATVAIKDI